MGRKIRKEKPLIFAFYEGESEKEYLTALRDIFKTHAVIRLCSETGTFFEAKSQFRGNVRLKDMTEIIDEVWFFYDVEEYDRGKWGDWLKIIKDIRRKRKRPGIKVRLLMTSACIEYWLLLHYDFLQPSLSPSFKNDMLRRLKDHVPYYKKGDPVETASIAQHYQTACENGRRTLLSILPDNDEIVKDEDKRNEWLQGCGQTFSTVQEAIEFLKSLYL